MPTTDPTHKFHKILIADDSTTERLNLTRILETAGYQVIQVHSGNEAKQGVEHYNPDLIMLDIIMDDGDGYQACRALKRNPVTQNIPIVMVSSKSNPVDRQWAEKLGANGYIIKPYSDQDVLQAITALEQQR
jgi:CheY-like chemotaxis protein